AIQAECFDFVQNLARNSPTARDLRECLGTPSAAKSAHAEPCRASAQSRLIVVATSARLPSGSASVHQAGLVPFDEARHLPKAFNGLAGSVRLTRVMVRPTIRRKNLFLSYLARARTLTRA